VSSFSTKVQKNRRQIPTIFYFWTHSLLIAIIIYHCFLNSIRPTHVICPKREMFIFVLYTDGPFSSFMYNFFFFNNPHKNILKWIFLSISLKFVFIFHNYSGKNNEGCSINVFICTRFPYNRVFGFDNNDDEEIYTIWSIVNTRDAQSFFHWQATLVTIIVELVTK